MQTVSTRTARLTLLAVLILATGALAGCAPGSATAASSWPGVAANDTTAYVAYGPAVYALNLENGQEVWHYPRDANRSISFYASPVLTAEGDLIVGGYDKVVYRLNANGSEVWRFEGSGDRIIGSAALADTLVLVPSADHFLYALDLETGRLAWSFEAKSSLWAAPLVDGDRVYLASLDHLVYALQVSDGSLLWSQDLGAAMADTPVLVDGVLLVATFGAGLQALDAETGQILWSIPTEGWVWGSPNAADGIAYFGDVAGYVYAVDLASQRELWRIQPDGPVAETPALADGTLYFGTEAGSVYARQAASGTSVWEQPLTGKLYSDLLLRGDTLLVASLQGDAVLTALDAASGVIRWSFTPTE